MLYVPHQKILRRYHLALDGRMSSLCGYAETGADAIEQLPDGATLCGKCLQCLKARTRRGALAKSQAPVKMHEGGTM